jgi:hypothetical protein
MDRNDAYRCGKWCGLICSSGFLDTPLTRYDSGGDNQTRSLSVCRRSTYKYVAIYPVQVKPTLRYSTTTTKPLRSHVERENTARYD